MYKKVSKVQTCSVTEYWFVSAETLYVFSLVGTMVMKYWNMWFAGGNKQKTICQPGMKACVKIEMDCLTKRAYTQQRLSLCRPEGWWAQESLLQRTGGQSGERNYKLWHDTESKQLWRFSRPKQPDFSCTIITAVFVGDLKSRQFDKMMMNSLSWLTSAARWAWPLGCGMDLGKVERVRAHSLSVKHVISKFKKKKKKIAM